VKVPRIAIVSPSDPIDRMTEKGEGVGRWYAFFSELRRLGRTEGETLVVERHSGLGFTERYAELTRIIVQSNPDAIYSISNILARHFKEATNSIPIVTITGDPIALGLTTSLSRPNSNMTGVIGDAGFQIWEKRFELLRQAFGSTPRVGFLVSKYSWEGSYGGSIREIGARMELTLVPVLLSSPIQDREYENAFDALKEGGVDVVAVNESAENFTNRRLIVELANARKLPAFYPFREFADEGGLIAYTTDLLELFRHAAVQIDQTLRGVPPAEIPYYQVSKFELVINLKTAKALGIIIPPLLLAVADEIIE
jgi:putative ABC transport system substrate-binding protein